MPREAPQLDRTELWMHSVVTHPDGAEAGIKANSTKKNEQALPLVSWAIMVLVLRSISVYPRGLSM